MKEDLIMNEEKEHLNAYVTSETNNLIDNIKKDFNEMYGTSLTTGQAIDIAVKYYSGKDMSPNY